MTTLTLWSSRVTKQVHFRLGRGKRKVMREGAAPGMLWSIGFKGIRRGVVSLDLRAIFLLHERKDSPFGA
jgi:hypothetical protein